MIRFVNSLKLRSGRYLIPELVAARLTPVTYDAPISSLQIVRITLLM